jgi:tryptophan synthase alpha subunit
MDIKNIYENISIDEVADYQIKVKAELQALQNLLEQFKGLQITSETTDKNNEVCMIAINNANQRYLCRFINFMVQNKYPLISIICVDVPKKTGIQSSSAAYHQANVIRAS